MNPDIPQYCQPGPSTSNDVSHQPTSSGSSIQFPPYHYEMDVAHASASSAPLPPYPVPLPAWPDSQSFPPYMPLPPVNVAPPSPYMYPSTSGLRLPPAEQTPPNCLDWTINPVAAPLPQFKTTAEPLFALGYGSTISENWMEGDQGLQYSIKNFTFSTKRTSNVNGSCSAGQVDEYDSLLVSIPQVC